MQIVRGSWCSPGCTSGVEILWTFRGSLGDSGNLGHLEISEVVRPEFWDIKVLCVCGISVPKYFNFEMGFCLRPYSLKGSCHIRSW